MLPLVRKNIVLSPENVKKLVQRCIPKELIPVDWKCDKSDIHENLESLLEYSRGQLGMFENVNALFQALANFLAAPGCANLLQFDGIYMTLPRTHYSIKGGEYIYKTEVLELLSLPIPCPFKDWQADLVRLAMKSRLKCFEAEWRSRFNSNCEMIRVDVGTLKNYVDELIKHSRAFSCNSGTCVPPLPDFSNPTIEVESTDGCYEILKSFDEKYPIAKNKTFYARMFSWIATVGIQFKIILEESFMSADDSKATVRLFKIGKESYVMAHELLQSMKNKNMDVSEFEDEILQITNLATFNFREVAQKVKIEDMKNIEFIRINIRESTVTSIPIPAPDDTYCVPSSDALYNLISDMIVAKKVLQRIDRNQFVHIEKFFKIMEIIFPVEGGDYFISLNDVEWIKAKWEKTYEEHLKSSAPVKHIRKVRKGGFTEDDLDKELEYLNLYNCFPEMKREVEWAYKVITQERNSTLKLEDMHSAVFQCQMTVLLENLPNLFKFLHSQKMCMKWVPYLGCVMFYLNMADYNITDESIADYQEYLDYYYDGSIPEKDCFEWDCPDIYGIIYRRSNEVNIVLEFFTILVNIFHLLILTQKELRSTSIFILMMGICIADIFGFVISIYDHGIERFWFQELSNYFDLLSDTSPYQCLSLDYMLVEISTSVKNLLTAATRPISIWLSIFIAAIRTLSVAFPMSNRIQKLAKPMTATLVVLIVGFFCCLHIYQMQAPNGSVLAYPLKKYDIMQKRENFEYLVRIVPAVLYPFLAIFLIVELIKIRKRRLRMNSSEKENPDNTTKLILLMTFSFMMSEGLAGVSNFVIIVYARYANDRTHLLYSVADHVLLNFRSLNALSHFFICYWMSSQYRDTVKRILCCCGSNRKTKGSGQTESKVFQVRKSKSRTF
ncbi:hypothetical protein L5515_006383 [Caenorhabditis briggsae]|uniref:G-protein coupled receptors family 1 profile domain-containing protein n=1 Tax=Caenorhabditis briggsae TaxID=6238 RepID=A0AAE9JKW4_CAEBR|nr:hypothetical protein L5515_006383 [Caenorhabditis briggsae]